MSYTQTIVGIPEKENAMYPDTYIRTIKHHGKPLTNHQQKMQKLRNILHEEHDVYSFTQLEQRGQALIDIRNDILKRAGFKN